MLRAILFDFNGVLVDDEGIHLELFQQVLAEEGVSLSEEEYYGRYLALDDRGCFSQVLAGAGEPVDPARLSRLIARKASYYRERIRREGFPFFSGALELVGEAAAAGLALGVVSGALQEEVEGALRQAGLRDSFKVLVTAEDVDSGKPDPQGYQQALAALNSQPPLPERLLHPHEVLAVEDAPAGVAAAGAVGLVTLGIAHTYPAERLSGADLVAESLEGLDLATLQTRYAEASRR